MKLSPGLSFVETGRSVPVFSLRHRLFYTPILVRDVAAVMPIAGVALRLEAADLPATDAHGGENYTRVAVALASGRAAQVYVGSR